MNKKATAVLLLSLGIAMGGILSFIVPKPNMTQTIEWLETPRNIANFNLETETGNFNNQSLIGRWTIVLFGFLQCPDVCPTGLMQLSTFADYLAKESLNSDVAYVFVSVDPERDSVTQVGQFVKYFEPEFLGATGSEDQLTQFAKSLGIRFEVSADKDNYSVAHSVKFSIIDPEGVFRGRFAPGFKVEELIKDFKSRVN